MPRKPIKVKQALDSDDVLDLGAAQHRVAAVRDYGRLDTLWRNIRFPAMWTATAFVALGFVIFAGSTHRGGERLAFLPVAISNLIGQASGPTPEQLARIVDREVGSVREEARRLIAERSRLEQRLASLEHEVNDATGSIRRRSDATGSIGPAEPRGGIADAVPAAPPPAVREPPRPAAPLPSVQRQPEAEPQPAAGGGVTLATRSQFGLDLGSENTTTALRLRWQRLSERNKATLARLEPLIAVRDGTNGQPVLYLVAGPINDVADAATLCAQLRQSNVPCQPVPYDGQRLVLR